MAKKREKKDAHFTWPDAVVLLGAALILPVAIYQRNWFFLSLGLMIAAVIGVRVYVTKWMIKRTQKKP